MREKKERKEKEEAGEEGGNIIFEGVSRLPLGIYARSFSKGMMSFFLNHWAADFLFITGLPFFFIIGLSFFFITGLLIFLHHRAAHPS